MNALRIAIALSNPASRDTTFIAAHLERLKEVVLVLAEPELPLEETASFRAGALGYARALKFKLRRSAITRRLRRSRAQVVLAEYGPTGAELLSCCRRAGIPLVVHFHGFDAHSVPVIEKYHGYKDLLRDAAALIVVSRVMERQLLQLGAPRERLHYICYGIDVDHFSPKPSQAASPRFFAVGRFVAKKAPLVTLLAFREAWLQRPQARLVMAGEGPFWEMAWQVRKALGLAEVVEMPGAMAPAEVARQMNESMAFVQHSVTARNGDKEGTPLAVLEALASGLPVISTRHAGIADVVEHGRNGLLCDEFDLRAMAAHLVQVIDHPAQAAAWGREGRNFVVANNRVQDRIADLQRVLEQVAVR